MDYIVSIKNKSLKGTVCLPYSKSESNRVLIIRALCDEHFDIHNLSGAHDTQLLSQQLQNIKKYGESGICKSFPDKTELLIYPDITQADNQQTSNHNIPVIDAGAAGTTFRFLTAFLALQKGEWLLTGSRRMKERPVEILVQALNWLGADIRSCEKEGFPPLLIRGKEIYGKEIAIDGSVSSQYITALMLTAPCLPEGLIIHLTGKISSVPYIDMTLQIMKHFGIEGQRNENTISIPHQHYVARSYSVEADWSAASYWYEMAALAEEADLKITGLIWNSRQGDSKIADIMQHFSVQTEFCEEGIRITKKKESTQILNSSTSFYYDFSACPDLAQTVIVTCAALRRKGIFSGLESLKIKETDRTQALHNELLKTGAMFTEIQSGTWQLSFTEKTGNGSTFLFQTYEDHRMAMAFAPLALKLEKIKITELEVVRKSYPHFWEELKKAGFTCTE